MDGIKFSIILTLYLIYKISLIKNPHSIHICNSILFHYAFDLPQVLKCYVGKKKSCLVGAGLPYYIILSPKNISKLLDVP